MTLVGEPQRVWQMLDEAVAAAPAADIAWIEPPPPVDDWSLAPDAVRLLTSLVERLRPRHVVEFGAGLSTRVLARACSALTPPGAVTSIENDPEHAERVAWELAEDGVNGYVTALIATLVARHCGRRLRPVYMLEGQRFASADPADLVLIDGPPAVLGGRGGTLYQVTAFARIGTLILLDDAVREDEGAVMDEWRADFGDAIEIMPIPGFTKGLAAIVVRSDAFRRSVPL